MTEPRPPFFALCDDCSSRLAEHYVSRGRVLMLARGLALGVIRLAEAVAANTSAPPRLREAAAAFAGDADPEESAPLMLVVHAKLCATCTRRVARDWGPKDPIALTPAGALLAAELVHEMWSALGSQPVGLALLAEDLAKALVDDLGIELP